MHVLGVIGRGTNRETLERAVDRLVDELSTRGRVGVVRYDATIADGTPTVDQSSPTVGGDVTYELGVDGDWLASGTGLSVRDALDALATDCDYAVVTGVAELQYPCVLVGSDGDRETATENEDEDEDGDEVTEVLARVPAVADLESDAVADTLERREPYETLESLVDRVKTSPHADRAGAIATFTGRVRAKDFDDDDRTEYLEFEKYEGVADERLAALREDLESREGVYAVEMHHRTGVVRDGEDIVFVVVLAGHRREAFRTVEDGIDRLKDEVPLFKKEVTVGDEFWVHDRE
ncbi:molybdopterin synthase [Halobacteria archaeon AArc-m2/3/4]|uniref:Molybdopterin synthase n=1 Tax=Natronoglomus mannanivorans TaxID=2979990 RepID=A0ABT2QCV2_9EURY|nr:molybdopterin synthase [Halobacteria archaeon AArc-m2/3/4]